MNQKQVKKNLTKLIIAIILFAITGILGIITNVFSNLNDILQEIHFSPSSMLRVILVIAFLYAINSLLKLIFLSIKVPNGRSSTLYTIFKSLVQYFIIIVGFCWILLIIGVNVSTVFASVGIIALIIGFGAESLVADVVTGIFIILENQFNIGDIIEVDGYRGVVIDIGIRTISIRDAGGNIKIINNSNLENIINRSNQKSVAITEIGVAYDTDLYELENKLKSILEEIKNKNKEIFIGDVQYLGVEELSTSSIVLKFKAEVDECNIFEGRRILNKELKMAFDRENIVIAYNRIDVHSV